jgi:hypothetical protein
MSDIPGAIAKQETSQIAEIRAAASVLVERMQFMRQAGITFKGMRDLYEILGYERLISTRQYRDRYSRGGIAKRIVETLPKATWRGDMELVEDENPKVSTAFEQAWDTLETRLKIKAVLQRADILAGLSTYAVILIGAPGDLNTELPKGKPESLLYLSPFLGGGGPGSSTRSGQIDSDCTIQEFEIDATNPRFGLPKTYQIRRVDITTPDFQLPVHWSRIIHVAEGCLDDEVYGQPALENVWNLLDDLDKVTGGGAEAFWLRANAGLQLNVDKDMTLSEPERLALKEQADDYQHQMRRMLRTRGVEVNQLGSDVANFNSPADAILTQIAGSKGIPKRILTGAEMGELASSQDRENFKDVINGRQLSYAGPYIVRPLIDRLIQYGYLPTPKKGARAYEVRWPHIQTLTEQEKAEGAGKWASVNQTQGAPVFTEAEIRDKWYGMEPLTPKQIADATPAPPAAAAPPAAEPPAAAPPAKEPPAAAAPEPKAASDALDEELVRVLEAAIKANNAQVIDEILGLQREPLAATDGPHTYSSTQVQLPVDIAEALLAFGQSIPDEQLAGDGRETDAHVTVKYGLHTQDASEVQDFLDGWGTVFLTLGETQVFSHEDQDVLVVRVISPDLVQLNGALSQELEVTDTYPEYHPHATIAYLQPGMGEQYAGRVDLAGLTATLGALTFSPAEGDNKTEIDLTEHVEGLEPETLAFDPNQPRDPDGKWTGTGGGGGNTEPWQSSGGFEHTGITWKQEVDPVTGRPIPIQVSDVSQAAALVLEGKVVEVPDVATAHTLIVKLAQMAVDAKNAGDAPVEYDLCHVSVAGSNLFCADSIRNAAYPEGIPRIEMPQLGGKPVPGSEADKLARNPWDPSEVDGSKHFIAHLQGIGIKTSAEMVKADSLKASQREMQGHKVGKMMDDRSFDPAGPANPLFVSSDNYVVDGHHRWAAAVGRDLEDGRLGDATVSVVRVNAPISEVLHLANAWSTKFGIQQAEGVTKQAKATGLRK